jgi:peptidoglycan/LPS O-acetylase OafA/YrhL
MPTALTLLGHIHFHNRSELFLACFALSCAYAQVSWWVIEKPILHGGSRRARRRELAAAVPHHSAK